MSTATLPVPVISDLDVAFAADALSWMPPMDEKSAPNHKHRTWGTATLAWTEDAEKVYVLRRAKRGWVVVTALPTIQSQDGLV